LKGCLRPYSSVYCLGATYCFLNIVTPKIFFELVSALRVPQSRRDPLGTTNFDLILNAKPIATMLGEDTDIVRTMDYRHLLLGAAHEEQKWHGSSSEWLRVGREIYICPVCWNDHLFHSIFHCVKHLERCPVHGLQLERLEPLTPKQQLARTSEDTLQVDTLLQHLFDNKRKALTKLLCNGSALDTSVFQRFIRQGKKLLSCSRMLYANDYQNIRDRWLKLCSSVYMSSPKGIPEDVRRVLGDSPFSRNSFTHYIKLNSVELEKILAAIEALGFEQLIAMAWTSHVLTRMEDFEGLVDAAPFERSTEFDQSRRISYFWGQRMSVSAAMANGCRRLMYDRLFGLISDTSNGLQISDYQAAGEILVNLGLVDKSYIDVTIIRYKSHVNKNYKGEIPRESSGSLDIVSSRSRFACYRYLKPWADVFNIILAYATACGFTRRISLNHQEKWGLDPAVRVTVSRAGKLALSIFLRSDPEFTLNRKFSEWFNNYRQHEMLLPWLMYGRAAFSVRQTSSIRKRRFTRAIVIPGDAKDLGQVLL
jgi:hypothetical protein